MKAERAATDRLLRGLMLSAVLLAAFDLCAALYDDSRRATEFYAAEPGPFPTAGLYGHTHNFPRRLLIIIAAVGGFLAVRKQKMEYQLLAIAGLLVVLAVYLQWWIASVGVADRWGGNFGRMEHTLYLWDGRWEDILVCGMSAVALVWLVIKVVVVTRRGRSA